MVKQPTERSTRKRNRKRKINYIHCRDERVKVVNKYKSTIEIKEKELEVAKKKYSDIKISYFRASSTDKIKIKIKMDECEVNFKKAKTALSNVRKLFSRFNNVQDKGDREIRMEKALASIKA